MEQIYEIWQMVSLGHGEEPQPLIKLDEGNLDHVASKNKIFEAEGYLTKITIRTK